jgi:tRNA(adenine34) deaminase
MRECLALARTAAAAGEVPVGALLEHDGRVLAVAHNCSEAQARSTVRYAAVCPVFVLTRCLVWPPQHDPTAHAEMLCVRAASGALRGWHELPRATLYVTLEPCAMCAGALLQARVGALVWGAPNPLLGADGSWVSLLGRTDAAPPARPHAFNPRLAVRRGVLADECGALMRDFFRARRAQQASDDAAPSAADTPAASPLS